VDSYYRPWAGVFGAKEPTRTDLVNLLDFCLWMHQNFDRLVEELNVRQRRA